MERRLYETELFCGLLVLLVNVVQVVGFDPCIPGSHKEFPDVNFGDRNENCIHEAGSECDYYLPAKWYSSKLGDLATECPQTGTCGVIYPAWINGSFPTEEEDIVNLTICIKFKNDCCHDNSLTAQVKNCSDFFVYYLPTLIQCPSVYCFDSDLPCKYDEPLTSSSSNITSSSTAPSVSVVSSTITESTITDKKTYHTEATTQSQQTSLNITKDFNNSANNGSTEESTYPSTGTTQRSDATATAVIHEAVQTYIAVLVTVLVVIKAVVFLRSKCGKRITKKAVPYECLPARPETGEYNLIGRIRESTPARASYLTPTMDMRSSNTQADAAC
ncbi:uncharacterized protein LOC128238649 [Mya arenaria]|uniref:uncharacterized protein LOC128238649 n=1 Tax=Mya arenaria TaxID=6604 RepID=UPI0022E94036|nr:uncharacterized protein LOC128238649 [Mya arenaria]